MRALSVVAAVGLMVAGCAPTTMVDLKSTATQREDFYVPRSYQDVYRTLLPVARKCWNVTGGLSVLGDLYTDQNRGEITFEMKAFDQRFLGTIDIAQEGVGARVRSYISNKASLPVRAWAAGSTDC